MIFLMYSIYSKMLSINFRIYLSLRPISQKAMYTSL